jgi:hypothetical protein
MKHVRRLGKASDINNSYKILQTFKVHAITPVWFVAAVEGLASIYRISRARHKRFLSRETELVLAIFVAGR